MGLALVAVLVGMIGCINHEGTKSQLDLSWVRPGDAPPLKGFRLFRSYVPPKLPDWVKLEKGEYVGGKIVYERKEFPVVMQEWRNENGWIIHRVLIRNVAIFDKFTNFSIIGESHWEYGLPRPGFPGSKAETMGKTLYYDIGLYNLLFTHVEMLKPPPRPNS